MNGPNEELLFRQFVPQQSENRKAVENNFAQLNYPETYDLFEHVVKEHRATGFRVIANCMQDKFREANIKTLVRRRPNETDSVVMVETHLAAIHSSTDATETNSVPWMNECSVPLRVHKHIPK